MIVSFSPTHTAYLVIAISLAIQVGFASGVFGPAWLSPGLSLPALAAMTWLWRRAEQQNASSQAFAALVI